MSAHEHVKQSREGWGVKIDWIWYGKRKQELWRTRLRARVTGPSSARSEDVPRYHEHTGQRGAREAKHRKKALQGASSEQWADQALVKNKHYVLVLQCTRQGHDSRKYSEQERLVAIKAKGEDSKRPNRCEKSVQVAMCWDSYGCMSDMYLCNVWKRRQDVRHS